MWPLNTNEDAAKTQVYLAASGKINQEDVTGQYWVPTWSWTLRYVDCGPEELTKLGKDLDGHRRLWEFSEEAVGKVQA